MIHTVKGFSLLNEPEVDVLMEFSCFFYDRIDVGNLISGSPAFDLWFQPVHLELLGSRIVEDYLEEF